VIAWPAFAVLIAPGIWNITAVHPRWGTAYTTTLVVKIVVVAASGLTAFLHTRAFGALSGLPRSQRCSSA
jgi:hypothetical protein